MPRTKRHHATRSEAGVPSLRSQSLPDRTSLPEDALLGEFQIGKDARTLGASVTNALRNAIIRGKLAPGRSLGQEYLARLFDVSRGPIRESLHKHALAVLT